MPVNILFVCLGNICRSPTAHGVFQRLVDEKGLSESISVDSAGTGAWHVGKAPDGRATAAARQRGYDLTPLRARQVRQQDFVEFDYIIAMDDSNLSDLMALYRAGGSKGAEPVLFLDRYLPVASESSVPDPYYGGDEGFEHVLNLVEAASLRLLNTLIANHPELHSA